MPVRVYRLMAGSVGNDAIDMLKTFRWCLRSMKLNTRFQSERNKTNFDIDIEMLIDFVNRHIKLIEKGTFMP